MTREYFTNEFLKHIQTTDSIMSTRGYKELCQEVLDTRAEIDRLIDDNAKFQEMATRKMTDLRAELARRDEQTTSHLAWMAEQGNTITGLRNELKDRDEIITRLKEALPTLKVSHNYCEDKWYSCPLSEDGCCNEAEGEDCNCGADEHNSKIDALMKELENG